jgi:hypothetical protein
MKAPSCQFNRMLGKMKVLSIEACTTLSMEELGAHLTAFFGKGGLGLDVKKSCPGCITFAGDGGYVSSDYFPERKKTRLHIMTSKWDLQVRRFITELP